MAFSMARTWADSIALVRDRLVDLLLVSLAVHVMAALIALPMLSQWVELAQVGALGADPQVELQRAMASMQSVMGLSMIGNLLQLIGYAAMVALLGPDRPTLGQALITGLKAAPTIFVSVVFLIVGMYIALLVVVVVLVAAVAAIIGTAALAQGELSPATAAPLIILAMILYVGLIVGFFYLMLRFVALLPVVAIERQYNPFTALGRSWSLTRTHGWRILGFWLLIWIPLTAIYGALLLALVPGIFSLNGAVPNGIDLVPMFAMFVPISVLLGMFFSAIVVATHRQLVEDPVEPAPIEP